MRDPVLVHLLVDGGDGLLERRLQELLVIVMVVVVRCCAGLPLEGAGSHVLEAAVQQG